MKNPNHPIWDFLRFTTIVASLTIVLYKNANNFDITEWKAIGEFGVMLAGGYTAKQFYLHRNKQDE